MYSPTFLNYTIAVMAMCIIFIVCYSIKLIYGQFSHLSTSAKIVYIIVILINIMIICAELNIINPELLFGQKGIFGYFFNFFGL